MNMESYKMTLTEAMLAVEEIIARGNDAEVRRAAGGKYIVYEVTKTRKKIPRKQRGHND